MVDLIFTRIIKAYPIYFSLLLVLFKIIWRLFKPAQDGKASVILFPSMDFSLILNSIPMKVYSYSARPIPDYNDIFIMYYQS